MVLREGEGRGAVESVIERVTNAKEKHWRALEGADRTAERKGLTAMEREVIL